MKIWLISLFEATPMDKSASARFVGIANAALKRGHEVVHFTSTFRHTSKKQRFGTSKSEIVKKGYSVEYIRSMSYKKNMRPKRFIAHSDFADKLIADFSNRKNPDIIFVGMPPLSVADKVGIWAKKRNIPMLVDIIDPWPDSFIKDVPTSLKPSAKVVFGVFYAKIKRILKNATALSSISNGYLEWAMRYLENDSKPTKCSYPAVDFNWIKNRMSALEKEGAAKSEKLRLIYAGSLASSYDIYSICKAAEILDQKYPRETEFVIAGTGPQEDSVKKFESQLANLNYVGWVNQDELTKEYFLADLGLIQHMNSLTQTVTYKLFNYLSAGLPVLNSLQSEMVGIIESNRVGLNNEEQDYQQLAANIEQFLKNPEMLKEYKENALKLTAQKGDAEVVYDDLIKFLEQNASKSQFSNT